MSHGSAADRGGSAVARRRRRWFWLGGLVLLTAGGAVGIHLLLQPERMGALAVAQAENALGLRIIPAEPATLAMWPGLRLRLSGVRLLDPFDDSEIGGAERVDLALPLRVLWSKQAELGQIDLRAPRLLLPALERWLRRSSASGPPAPLRIPDFAGQIGIEQGQIIADDWELEDLSLEVGAVRDGSPVAFSASATLRLPGAADGMPLLIELQATPRQDTDGVTVDVARLNTSLGMPSSGNSEPGFLAEGTITLQPTLLALDLRVVLRDFTSLLPETLPPATAELLSATLEQPLLLSYSGTPDLDGTVALNSTDPARPLQASALLAPLIAWAGEPDAEAAAPSPLPPLQLTTSVDNLQIDSLAIEGLSIELTPDTAATAAETTAALETTERPQQ